MSIWCLQFYKKRNENNSIWGIIKYRDIIIHSSKVKLKITKKHFEINWPLINSFSKQPIMLPMFSITKIKKWNSIKKNAAKIKKKIGRRRGAQWGQNIMILKSFGLNEIISRKLDLSCQIKLPILKLKILKFIHKNECLFSKGCIVTI